MQVSRIVARAVLASCFAAAIVISVEAQPRSRSTQQRTVLEHVQRAKRFVVSVLHRLGIPPAPEPAPAPAPEPALTNAPDQP